MKTFIEFLEAGGAFGTAQNYINPFGANARQIGGNTPYLTTGSLTSRDNSLMGSRRRQLLDEEDPSQRYHYYITLLRNIIADVDTGKLLCKNKGDKYNIVYTKSIMTAKGYPPEEQVKLNDELKVFKWDKGFGYNSLLNYFHQDFDKILEFKQGKLDPNINQNLKYINGYYIDNDVLIATRDKLEKYLERQSTFERGGQYLTQNIGNQFLQGALMNRFKATPTTSSR